MGGFDWRHGNKNTKTELRQWVTQYQGMQGGKLPVVVGLPDERNVQFVRNKTPFIYGDHAYFDRGWDKYHFRLCRDGHHQTEVYPRPNDRLKKWKVNIEPWRKGGRDIVLIPPSSFYERIYKLEKWTQQTIDTLKLHTDRHIHIKQSKGRLRECLLEEHDAHALVCALSAAGMEAALMGVPVGFLEVAHEKLKKGFVTSIRIFSNLIEMREGTMAGHSQRVAELSRAIALQMGMNEADIQDVFLAALLHDVGKIGLPDYLLEKPFANMNTLERVEFMKHPIKGQMALMALEQLQGAAQLIRGHHEHVDGQGYPDRLRGMEIPLGARIIALANEFDSVQNGTLSGKQLKPADAVLFIQEGSGGRYDPAVVEAFIREMKASEKTRASVQERVLHADQVKNGMVLSRDLVSSHGELLLSKEHVLDANLIGQIQGYSKLAPGLVIYVYDR